MTRKHPFRPADLDGDRLALYRSIIEGRRAQGPRLFDLVSDNGVLLGPFNEFLLRPALGDALQRVGAAVRYAGSLGGRAREMAVLVVAAHWDSAFERTAHEAVGRAAGLTARSSPRSPPARRWTSTTRPRPPCSASPGPSSPATWTTRPGRPACRRWTARPSSS
ncbi:hypothetical protein amrb99_22830 [Actinomadura sp. RB99]|uniref:hypothetical protein n=1 Tax=Actinomadura sp. RB99 TaxID=2691577 RepID=UPI0019AD3288|nr:hypothetical protein [Actinomadura sp. RB99]MBD2893362.1 hypothetical protein [Actinomadura sp. RB99]